MDNIVDTIKYDIAFNLGWSLFCSFIGKVNSGIKKEDYPPKIKQVSEKVFGDFRGSDLETEEFEDYILSAEFRKIIQTYYSYLYHNQESELPEVELNNIVSKRFPDLPAKLLSDFIENVKIYYEKLLNEIVEDGNDSSISASHYLNIGMNKQIISEIIQNRRKIDEIYSTVINLSKDISDDDIDFYHRLCEEEYGKIRFSGIVGAERSPFQDISDYYIRNRFKQLKNHKLEFDKKGIDSTDYTLESFFDCSNKIVIIGNAGYGKSTTVNYIYCNFEKLYGENLFKIKINLKDYASLISKDKQDVLTCLAQEVNNKIQSQNLTIEDLRSKIGDYLYKGKGLVIFDALDEITTLKARKDVREAISFFCNTYSLSKYIVTSREVGYLSNDFDDDFLHYRICEFTEKQVELYVDNWLKINNYPEDSRKEFKSNFNSAVDNAKCKEIITSPIILILALIIFNIDNRLPKNRISFYEKCIKTFLLEREEVKDTVNESFKEFVTDEGILPGVANYKFAHTQQNMDYIFNRNELRAAILKSSGIDKTQEFFVNAKLADFIDYLIHRTELIREEDEGLYNFSHKSFYDYFVAKYYSTHYEFDELKDVLMDWIGDSGNDELSRLVIENLKINNSTKYGKIMDYLFDYVGFRNIHNSQFSVEEQHKFIAIFDIFEYLHFTEMMTPKSKLDFYKFWLKNSSLKSMRSPFKEVDNQEMLKHFQNAYESEGILDILDSLSFISPNFSSLVVKTYNSDKLIVKLNEFLKYCQTNQIIPYSKRSFLDRDNKGNSLEKKEQLINYFINEQSELVASSPFLYLTILSFLIKTRQKFIEKLPKIKFKSRTSLYFYTLPSVVFAIIDLSYNDIATKKYLLTLLKSTVSDNYDSFFDVMKLEKRLLIEKEKNIPYEQAWKTQEYKVFKDYCYDLERLLEEPT